MATMRIVETPESNDVLCGKDKTFNRNIGNITYRKIIVSTAMRYSQLTTKPEKMKVTAQIVHTMIHTHKSRFLKQVMIHGSVDEYYWQEISITAARDKTSHALRFCASQMQHSDRNPVGHMTDLFEASSPMPITPPLRRSMLNRPHFSRLYKGSNKVMSASTTKRTHRRTVSTELAIPLLVTRGSIGDKHPDRNGTELPIPMECKSSFSSAGCLNTAMHHNYHDDIEAILREPLRWEDAVDDECYDENENDHSDRYVRL